MNRGAEFTFSLVHDIIETIYVGKTGSKMTEATVNCP